MTHDDVYALSPQTTAYASTLSANHHAPATITTTDAANASRSASGWLRRRSRIADASDGPR